VRYIFILFLIFLPSSLYASENVEVELYKDGKSVLLNSYQMTYLYGNAIGYLSTCRHLQKVTGTTYTQEKARDELDMIKSANHLKITFSKGSPSLPIVHGNQQVDEIFVGFDSKGFPDLLTVHKDKIQLYSKCSGSIALINFSCDKVLSELLSFKIDDERCKIYLKEIKTSLY
jgi:hypothetical protein